MADNAEFMRGVYEAFSRGDVPTVLAAVDPKIDWNEAEHHTFWPGGPFVGPEAVLEGVFARIPATFGDTFRIEIARILEFGPTVVMEGRYKGMVQATGKDLDVQVTHVWDIADGKIVKFQQYTDAWQWAKATGETPLSAAAR